MSYTFVIGENSITLFNIDNGNSVTVFEDDSRFAQFKDLVQTGEYEFAEALDVKTVVQNFIERSATGSVFVDVTDGIGTVNLYGQVYPLADAITNRIVKMIADGFSAQPLVNFLENLYKNPSKTAIDELFLFLDSTGLPITTDGCFIAYKIVKEDFMDIYTGKMDNSVGKTVEMPRFAVDDKRQNTCSAGLHFCSKDYLAHYGSSKQETDKCVLVKINPADVVSIPSDYNNAKGRTCKYEVVGVMNETDWRKVLTERDYNSQSVVDECGNEGLDEVESDDLGDAKYADDSYPYYFDTSLRRWRDTTSGKIVSRDDVIYANGLLTFNDVINLETIALRNS